MIIAVSGASGFIGSELVKYYLNQGYEVRVLSRKKTFSMHGVKLFTGDINDNEETILPFLANVDIFYHCAAELNNEAAMHATNIQGTANLLKMAEIAKIGVWVQLSSTGVYGYQPHKTITETTDPAPENLYERTKLASDELVLKASSKGVFRTVILRPSNVFGRHMKNTSLFSLIKMISSGMFFFIGNRRAVANYVHVDNVIYAMELIGKNKTIKTGSIYIISDQSSLVELVGTVCETLNKNPPTLRLPERPIRLLVSALEKMHISLPLSSSRINALTQTMTYSSQKLHDELAFVPVTPLKAGIKDLTMAMGTEEKIHA